MKHDIKDEDVAEMIEALESVVSEYEDGAEIRFSLINQIRKLLNKVKKP